MRTYVTHCVSSLQDFHVLEHAKSTAIFANITKDFVHGSRLILYRLVGLNDAERDAELKANPLCVLVIEQASTLLTVTANQHILDMDRCRNWCIITVSVLVILHARTPSTFIDVRRRRAKPRRT